MALIEKELTCSDEKMIETSNVNDKRKVYGTIIQIISVIMFVLCIPLLLVPPFGFIGIPVSVVFFIVGRNFKKHGTPNEPQKAEPKKEVKVSKKELLLEWQNAVVDNHQDKLYMSRKELERCTIDLVDNDIRIFQDSVNIAISTKNPDTFFERIQLAENKIQHIAFLEPYIAQIRNFNPSVSIREIVSQWIDRKAECIKVFIDRYYASINAKAESMKTEKGKQNQYTRFYESLEPYFYIIGEENVNYIKSLMK